jgi:hypothetical protein
MQNLILTSGDLSLVSTVNSFMTKAFNAVIDFIYTQVSIVFDFFTQPTVLWTLAGLSIIYIAYRWIKEKTHSVG